MIVVDASVIFHILMDPTIDPHVLARTQEAGDLAAPHILDPDVIQALRRGVRAKNFDETRATTALGDLQDFTIERHATNMLNGRIWEMRNDVTAYDAAYVALAELLSVPLYTRDRRLAAAAGPTVQIVTL